MQNLDENERYKSHGAIVTWCVDHMGEPKGYGFIRPDGETEEIFFHRSETNIPREKLLEGTRVRFSIIPGNTRGRSKASAVEFE